MKLSRYIIGLFLILIACKEENKKTETNDKNAIIKVLKSQERAWSNHDIEEYMNGYWKSDSLKFYGSSGLTFGWDKTLANYKKGYPTAEHTGTLNFDIENITKISIDSYYVVGSYHLTRSVGNAEGVFMIIFKRIDGNWRIIADTSC